MGENVPHGAEKPFFIKYICPMIIIIIIKPSKFTDNKFVSTNRSQLEGKLHRDVDPIFVESIFNAFDVFGVDNISREIVPVVNGPMIKRIQLDSSDSVF